MGEKNNAEDEKLSVLDRELINVQTRIKKLEEKEKKLEERLALRIGKYILKEKNYGTFKEFKEDYDKNFKEK